MKTQPVYQYKGFEILKNTIGTTIKARRYYPASVHRGFPQPWTPVIENAPSAGQAAKVLEDFVAAVS